MFLLIKTLLITFFTAAMQFAWAQIAPIDTDRPDQTESAFLVPAKWLQFEAGFNFQKNSSHENEFLTPTLLTKYGLSKRIELRLITTIRTSSTALMPYGINNESGLDAAEVGAKISLFKEKKILPTTSFIFHIGVPAFSSVKFKPDKVAPNFRFTMQHTLSANTSLGYNLGCEWDGFTNDPAYIYTLTAGYTSAEKWYMYIEAFGAIKKQILPEHTLDGGFAYYITNNFKIDLSSGFGITKAAPDWYMALGFSARFKL
ncbi:MAG: transporter [Bacteroidota bacterium]|nr:transporter [Bacteroidota bacterium]